MLLEEMKLKRKELGLSYKDIAEAADMSLSTVQKIFGGSVKAPRRESLMKIQAVLTEQDSKTHTVYQAKGPSVPILAEPAAVYGAQKLPKKQGEYTLEDYYALPDEQRVELIDGVFYDMSAPSSPHQFIGGSIFSQLLQFRNDRKGKCLPMVSPVDVQLDCDNKTMVQQDVLIVCDRSKVTRRCVYGAPDFIVEVLSPSTRKKDMNLKMSKYGAAGVREYWMIDPDQRRVAVFDLEHLAFPVIYGFGDQIPVGIWNGECKIDLTDVCEILDDLFGEDSLEEEQV